MRVDSEQYTQRINSLLFAIKYESDEIGIYFMYVLLYIFNIYVYMYVYKLGACKTLLTKSLPDDPETSINQAAILYKEGDYEGARLLFYNIFLKLF